MAREWKDFYRHEDNLASFLQDLHVNEEFLVALLGEKPKKILEVGCGPGWMSIFLSHLGCNVTGVDDDDSVLNIARKNNERFNGRALFLKANAFNLPYENGHFDLAFSQGLLEHFDDDDILDLMKEKVRVAKVAAFSVPNSFYKHKDFGDERLLPKAYWERLLQPFDIIESKNYYSTRMKRNFLMKRPVMYMCKLRMCRK